MTIVDNARRAKNRGAFAQPGFSSLKKLECRLSYAPFPDAERCQSGRLSSTGNAVYRKVTRVRIPASPPFFLPGNGRTGKAGGHPEDIRRRPVRFRELVYELPEEVSRPAAPCVAVAVHEAVSVAGIHLVRRIVEFRERIAFTPQHPSPVFVDDTPDILPSAQRPSSLKHRVPEIRRPRLQDILRPEDGVPHPFGDFRRRNLREDEPYLGCPGELSVCAASPVETELFVKASAVGFLQRLSASATSSGWGSPSLSASSAVLLSENA